MAPNPSPLAAQRILIVDDQDSIRDILRTALTEAGAVVLEATGGAIGVEMATRQVPDLILLDIAMPGMSGPALQEELRHRGVEIPIVFVTGHEDESVRPTLLAGGAVECLFKPFSDAALLGALNAALRVA